MQIFVYRVEDRNEDVTKCDLNFLLSLDRVPRAVSWAVNWRWARRYEMHSKACLDQNEFELNLSFLDEMSLLNEVFARLVPTL